MNVFLLSAPKEHGLEIPHVTRLILRRDECCTNFEEGLRAVGVPLVVV